MVNRNLSNLQRDSPGGGGGDGGGDDDGLMRRRAEDETDGETAASADAADPGAAVPTLEELRDIRAATTGDSDTSGGDDGSTDDTPAVDAESRDPRDTRGGLDALSPTELATSRARQDIQENTAATLRADDFSVRTQQTDAGVTAEAGLRATGIGREIAAGVEDETALDRGEDFSVTPPQDGGEADVELTDSGRQELREQRREDTVVDTAADTVSGVLGGLPGSDAVTDAGEALADVESDLTKPFRSAAGDIGDAVGDAPGVSATVDTVTTAGDTVGDLSSDAATGLQNRVLKPAAGPSARGVELVGQAVNPTTSADDPLDPEPETAPGQLLEGAFVGGGRSAADVTAGAPALAIGAAETTGSAVATASEEIGDDGVLGGSLDAAQAGVSATVASGADLETSARERPGQTAGGLLAGAGVGAGAAKAGRLLARRGPDAARRARDEFESFLDDERGQFDPGSDEQVQITKQDQRSDVDDRLADIQALDRDLEPREARQVAKSQLRDEAGSLDAIAPSQQARQTAIERRAAELQLRLRADRDDMAFDRAVPESQRFEAIEQQRTRLFDDGGQERERQATTAGRERETQATGADTALFGREQTAAAATAPAGEGAAELAADLPRPERDQGSGAGVVGEAFAAPPGDGQQTGLFDARADRDRETDTAFAAPPRDGQQVGDLFDAGRETDTDTGLVTPAPQREATDLVSPPDQQTDLVVTPPEPQTQTTPDPTPSAGPPQLAFDRPERRPPTPGGGNDPEDDPLFFDDDDSAESPFTNPVATAEEVLSSDVEGGGLTGANGSSSAPIGGER
jgi:hypothetical protein